jgi:hypothetical protein
VSVSVSASVSTSVSVSMSLSAVTVCCKAAGFAAPLDHSSDWAMSHAFVWDQALTEQKMMQVSTLMLNSLTQSLLGVFSGAGREPTLLRSDVWLCF